MVQAWTNALGGVTFSHTKDGTALALKLYMGTESASYIYGQSQAAENALREHTEWAMDWNSRGLAFNR
jgi:HKD family nuclease